MSSDASSQLLALPPELICHIAMLCSRSSLASLARTHSAFLSGAEEALYHTIDSPRSLDTLCNNVKKTRFVRRLIIYLECHPMRQGECKRHVQNLTKSLFTMSSLVEVRLGLLGEGRMYVGWTAWAKDLEDILCSGNFSELRILRCHSHDFDIARIISCRPELQVFSTNFLSSTLFESSSDPESRIGHSIPIIYTLKRARHDLEVNDLGVFPALYSSDRIATMHRVLKTAFDSDPGTVTDIFPVTHLSIHLVDSSWLLRSDIQLLIENLAKTFRLINRLTLFFERLCETAADDMQNILKPFPKLQELQFSIWRWGTQIKTQHRSVTTTQDDRKAQVASFQISCPRLKAVFFIDGALAERDYWDMTWRYDLHEEP